MRVLCSFCKYPCLGGLLQRLDRWFWCGVCSDGYTYARRLEREK